MTTAVVSGVSRDANHRFSKAPEDSITLIEGLGVQGDAHFGATVQHLSRVRRDPSQPNLRQVHLIHRELFDEVTDDVAPGQLGENITTDDEGTVVRKAGVMAVVVSGGVVRPGDAIEVRLPEGPAEALQPV